MRILGISCFYHDSAAALVIDGQIIAAVQEERFTRKKHDSSFPLNSIKWCLEFAGISINEIDYIVFYEKPFIKFERILETALSYAPLGIRQFMQAMPLWLKQKLWIPEIIKKQLEFNGQILFVNHHESHAASAFYPSPYDEAAFLTMDGVGEWDTVSFGRAKGNNLDIISTIRFPHSLGLLYSAFTYYLGFKVNSGEYKVMGLAPYGKPLYKRLILDNLIDLKDDGSFRLNLKYFGYCYGLKMTNRRFDRLFGKNPRKPESEITQRDMDIAASIQSVTEEVMLKMAGHVHKVTGLDKLCLAGGVALNCVGNARILNDGPFKAVWVQPASGDAGAALGAALFIWYKYLKNNRQATAGIDAQKASLLGPGYNQEDIKRSLDEAGADYQRYEPGQISDMVSDLVMNGKVVGWFQGRLEFGPRALGARSIIADPRSADMQSKLNKKIKYRESFRPFAPSVIEEKAGEWFEIKCKSPYMLFIAKVNNNKRIVDNTGKELEGIGLLKNLRSVIPAVTHVDYSARIQTVARQDNDIYYDLIDKFFRKTGCPVLINTSFNVRGEPLVCSPADAYRCFMNTEMDYLAIGNYILDKAKQKKDYVNRFNIRQRFEAD
ncbi:MAG: hypothetical protein C4533_03960 [Candidatus Omnitrophota bacterium]|jgi:carbamoyltransferase|nr:MAG: hypothetical protein C4533_03960 [Candidatus Omnitrophota bacterium]